ncbi:molybdopterin-dependent oxidoreductase [Nocardia sp. CDC159]|uniref:Molybdopterin-dependent oxidoreductase n=1 Tax=Nocardia pulmonis TaxID=2951408 RepID=A0A9X2ED91_9NOCA|nr:MULTISPECIES: molybdopterin-dependent oxidoreductase [Nocardia]MCM6778782.1 molybdopterin-dependent oxidoreductase [Nocardia pulmonis]MCM6791671.1 molybdopterin-dependent oxidoreductase [Nocardia sp. CDC159]
MIERHLPLVETGTRHQVHGACPLDCPDGCSWEVTVDGDRAVALAGRKDHPYTRGVLCAKVNHYLDQVYAEDRLLYPLRRLGPKGSGRFERVTWDRALSEIAERLTAIRDDYGGEAIWPYQGTGNLGYIQGLQGKAGSRLWNALGASEHAMTICSIAGQVGIDYATGTSAGIDPESLRASRLIILWGVNTLTSSHHLWRSITRARNHGARVVAIDPVATRTARLADEHIAPIPGSDGALAMGLLHVVVAGDRHDRDYLDRHTVGWPAFRRRILDFTVADAARISGVPAAAIIALGERIADTRPTAIRAGIGLQRHAGGGSVLRLLACIPAVTGDWQHHGGGLAYSTDGYLGVDREVLARTDLRPRPVRSLAMTRLADTLLHVQDPPVRALIVYGANPVVSAPDQENVRAALSRADLLTVVIDHFRTDTADLADYILPATMQPEHLDVHDGYGQMYVAWNEPAVPPRGECLPNSEIFRRLAEHLNLSDPCLYDSDEAMIEQMFATDHPSLAGITPESLRATGWARLSYPEEFVPFAHGFPTPSGRFEFHSERARRDGHDPLPGYVGAREVTDADRARRYPLSLIAAAPHYLLNSTFANNATLSTRQGAQTLSMHPDDAEARGLVGGSRVRVFNDRGGFDAVVTVTTAVRAGVVGTTKGQWRKLAGDSTVNATVDERDADMGGGAVFHDNRVQVCAIPDAPEVNPDITTQPEKDRGESDS